jgi:hypothetical protein
VKYNPSSSSPYYFLFFIDVDLENFRSLELGWEADYCGVARRAIKRAAIY